MHLARFSQASALLGSLFLAVWGHSYRTSQDLRVLSATLTASPEVYDGPGPVTIRFIGKITVEGKGTVKYTFVRSDGATGPVIALEFNGEKSKSVETTWTINEASYSKWMAIKILAPNELESEKAWIKGTTQPNTTVPAPSPGPSQGAGSNWDFEQGLSGWTATGDAFASQPTVGDNVTAARVRTDMMLERGGIGGDYWKRIPYPVGHHLTAWIGTSENHPNGTAPLGAMQGDSRTGTLTSGEFPLDEDHRFIAFMVGGGRDVAAVRVEVQVKTEGEKDAAEVTRIVSGNRDAAAALAALFSGGIRAVTNGVGTRDGQYVIAFTASGQNSEVMRQVTIEIPATLRGRRGRIRIIDNSAASWGHINTDDFRFGARRPEERPRRVWGFADTHAHPMNDLGFGGNLVQGSLYARDGSPYASEQFRRTALPAMFDRPSILNNAPFGSLLAAIGFGAINATRLQRSGYPEMQGYPSTSQMAGQTVYAEWVRRAYDGGLRLMSALAVNTWVISSHPLKLAVLGSPHPQDDRGSAELQIADMKIWAARPENRSWVEVAFTPADARRIISENKLAIVLGIELDCLGNFVPNNHFQAREAIMMPADPARQREMITSELDRLHKIGVRQIGPFHYVSGVWGGAAMSQRFFNDIHRGVTGYNVDVVTGDEGIRYRLDLDGWGILAVASRGALTQDRPEQHHGPTWSTTRGGHMNAMGLLPAGKILFDEMVRRGFLIDVDHASHRSVDDMLERAVAQDYPLMSSHADYLDLGFTGPGEFTYRGLVYNDESNLRNFDTTVQDPLRNERMITRNAVRTIANLGGVTGPILWLPRRTGRGDPVPNDCDGSSRTWAQAYQYAVEVSGGRGVALSTDRITVFPRFGPNASFPLSAESDSMTDRDERRFRQALAQRNGVWYDTPIREWAGFRFKLALGSIGSWQKTPVRDTTPVGDTTTWESHPVEIGDAWMASAAWAAGRNPRTNSRHGIDGGPRVIDYTWGFFSTTPSDVTSDGVFQLPGTLHSRYAAYCVKNRRLPSELSGLRPDLLLTQIWSEYWWVKRAWETWRRMTGEDTPLLRNEPLRRHVFGYRDLNSERIGRDFDVNIDGVAHYGMLPDFLQDVANSHTRPSEVGAYLTPLFQSAESYIAMWEKATRRR